jgi:periplasmic protein CpxP/Spy
MKKLGKIKVLAIASLLALALVASIAVAKSVKTGRRSGDASRPGWQGKGAGRGFHEGHDALWNRLNLTDDQKAKLKQIRESFAERNKPLLDELRSKRQELRQASKGDTFDEALATQKLTEMAALQAKLMGERFKLHQEMLSVLTPEQKTQLEQLRAQFKTHHGERRGAGERREDQ